MHRFAFAGCNKNHTENFATILPKRCPRGRYVSEVWRMTRYDLDIATCSCPAARYESCQPHYAPSIPRYKHSLASVPPVSALGHHLHL